MKMTRILPLAVAVSVALVLSTGSAPLRAQNRVEEAIPEYEIAIASNRNWLLAIATLGWCKFLTDVIPLEEKALRLIPRGPFVGTLNLRIGTAYLLQSRYEDRSARLKRPAMPPCGQQRCAPISLLLMASRAKASTLQPNWPTRVG